MLGEATNAPGLSLSSWALSTSSEVSYAPATGSAAAGIGFSWLR
jgi:hypothetical protein